MVTLWFLAFAINGLTVATVEPFGSEEACVLAAKIAQIPTFDCVSVSREVYPQQTE